MLGGRISRVVVPIIGALLFGPQPAGAQELRVVHPREAHWILEEISGDAAYEHIRYMTQFHRPTGGAEGLWEVAEYYEKKAREYGLVNVKLIKQKTANPPWNAELGEIWISGDRAVRVASTLQTPLHLADNSNPAEVESELVDIGEGTDPSDRKSTRLNSSHVAISYAVFC